MLSQTAGDDWKKKILITKYYADFMSGTFTPQNKMNGGG